MTTLMNRALIENQLRPGLDDVVDQNYSEIEANSVIPRIFEMRKSTKQDEEILLVGSFGEAFTKTEGGAIAMDGYQEEYVARFAFPTVALGFQITEEAMEDDLYETSAKMRAQGLGRAMAQTRESRAANILNLAYSTAQRGPDGGTPLIASTHPTLKGAGTPFDNTLTGQLSETSLQAARNKITRQKDARGNFTDAVPTKLIIPVGLYFTAHEILKSDLSTTPIMNVAGNENVSNSNVTNVIGSQGLFDDVIEVRRLYDDNAWFVQTNCPNGLMMYERKPLTVNDDYDEARGVYKYFARERYGFGWVDPRSIYGSQGA